VKHRSFSHLRHIQVSQFDDSFLRKEQIGTLDVSVADLQIVKYLKASHYLNEERP